MRTLLLPTLRPPRPRLAVVVLAVVAQVVSAVGFPAVRSGKPAGVAGCAGGACGCSVVSASGPDCCCAKPVAKPTCCAKPAAAGCCDKPADPAPAEPAVVWVLGAHARKCKGHGPDGPAAAVPAVPPPAPVGAFAAAPSLPVHPSDSFPVVRPHVPPDPPPRLG